ncbi:MAG TPA: YfhO family protein [Chitinophagaceae bacterium]|nr:YfhO family protein [Chitinophagaceae bacterium]
MNNGLLKKLVPHFIAVGVFLIVSVLYCRPALQGNVVSQHDVTQWQGAIHQSDVFKEQHGEYPLWTNSMFSGMPTFQIGYPSNNYIPWWVHTALTLHLPKPIQFFFLACICFYFLCIVLRVNPYVGIFGALSFAYATYNPVIIVAGHDTKMWSIAYMPALLGSILLVFNGRYWLGAGLTALFASVMIAMNHPQIDYYFFLAVGIMTLFFIAKWIREKRYTHLGKALAFTVFAAVIGLLSNAVTILSTYEYQKETIRGGYSALSTPEKGDAATGLSKDYAFGYSFSLAEPFVMLVPRMFGGSSGGREIDQEKSKAIEAITMVPQELQQQLPLSYYWGGISKSGPTSGPPYVGAVVCFLAILGMFVLDGKHKWWMATAILLAIVMSWGDYFESFNTALYHLLPLYNKFRAPSMILVIPQLLLPTLAVLTLQKLAAYENFQAAWPAVKKGLLATGVVLLFLFGLYLSFSFLGEGDKLVLKQVADAKQPQLTQYVNTFYEGLKEDRKSLMLGDIFRSLGYMVVAFGLIYLLLKKAIKPTLAFSLIAVLSLVDLLSIDANYLSSENYVEEAENEGRFQLTQADNAILADKSYYRVFNMAGDAFSEAITSYHFNSLGGYHAVKLRLYQDLIEKQLSKQQPNLPVLNMLNTKYFIQKDQNGLTQQYQKNDGALGAAWFVKNIRFVNSAQEEMQALDAFNPKDTAIVQNTFKQRTGNAAAILSGEGTIELVKNENDVLTYKTNNAGPGFAVFSEIFYNSGWNAFIDGKETPIAKVNYVLRGLPIPAGTHEIVFKFQPKAYLTGRTLTTIFSILMVLLLVAGIFFEWRRNKLVKKA